MSGRSSGSEPQTAGWRLKLGAALFALSIVLPLGGLPVVAASDLSAAMTTSVSGALLVIAELLGVGAVAVMGRSGYAYIKNLVSLFLRRYGPPNEVSRLRYRIGLVMFCLPILFGWLWPYAAAWIPALARTPLPYALGGDLLLLASLFVLGGNFWDKVRSLFVYDVELRFSSR